MLRLYVVIVKDYKRSYTDCCTIFCTCKSGAIYAQMLLISDYRQTGQSVSALVERGVWDEIQNEPLKPKYTAYRYPQIC